jgi:formate/nitrite transporter
MESQDVQALRSDALTPVEIEAKAEALGVAKANMGFRQAFVLSILAGLFIGLGGMFMLLTKSEASFPYVVAQLLGGVGFCLGLFIVITTGAELFTGNCLMICGKLSNRFTWGRMLKSWLIVYLGNLVGSLILVAVLFFAQYWAVNGEAVGNAMITVASSKINQGWDILLFKGILCNLLVSLAVWIAYAGRTIADKFFAIILPITAFVACGFEHCVANMFFLPMALALNASGFAYAGTASLDVLTVGGVLFNLSAVTLGNIVGGAVFVGVSYWLAYHKKETPSTQ